MSGFAGILRFDGETSTEPRSARGHAATRSATGGPTAKARHASTRAADSLMHGFRSSTFSPGDQPMRLAGASLTGNHPPTPPPRVGRRRAARCTACSTARSTTTASSAASSRSAAIRSARTTATRRCCCWATASGARACRSTCTACSPSRCGTRRSGACCWCGIGWGRSRCTSPRSREEVVFGSLAATVAAGIQARASADDVRNACWIFCGWASPGARR